MTEKLLTGILNHKNIKLYLEVLMPNKYIFRHPTIPQEASIVNLVVEYVDVFRRQYYSELVTGRTCNYTIQRSQKCAYCYCNMVSNKTKLFKTWHLLYTNALVICNHAPPLPDPGNSWDFDFSEIKALLKPLHCEVTNIVKAWLKAPALWVPLKSKAPTVRGPFLGALVTYSQKIVETNKK